MKFAKIFLASFVLVALTSAFVIKKQTTPAAKAVKTVINADKQLPWTGANQSSNDFVIASGTPSWLNDAGNWASSFATTSGGSTGTGKILKLRITYSYDDQEQTDPLTSSDIQDVIDAVRTNYVVGSPNSFSTPIQITKGSPSVTINIAVLEKN